MGSIPAFADINAVHSDHSLCRDLANCAAVCKDWVPHSRSLLFQTLNFYPKFGSLTSLLNLISSPHGTIQPHIKRIALPFFEKLASSTPSCSSEEGTSSSSSEEDVLSNPSEGDGPHEDGAPGDQRPIPMHIFLRVSNLSALQSITLFGIFRTHVPEDAIITVLAGLTQLRSLEIANLNFRSFPGLRDIVASCIGLQRLYINGIRCTERPGQSPTWSHQQQPPCPPLQLLSIVDCTPTPSLLDWVLKDAQACQLRAIFMDGNEAHRHQAKFGALLWNLGSGLQKLCIEQPRSRFLQPKGEHFHSHLSTPLE